MRSKHLQSLAWGFLTLLVGVGLTGCSTSGRTVSGEVKMDGKPLADAEIQFYPEASSGMGGLSGKTDQEGKFKIEVTSNLVKPGKYFVSISKFVDAKGKVPDQEELEQLKAAGKAKNLVPLRYNAPGETQLIVEITDGNNVLKPFELKSK